MKTIISIILLVTINTVLFSQGQQTDTLNEKTSHFLVAEVDFSDKTLYSGVEIGDMDHNYNGMVYYVNTKGWYTGLFGSWFSQMEPHYYSTIFFAGIQKSLNKSKSIFLPVSYYHYFYSEEDTLFDFSYKNSLSAGLIVKKKNIETGINTYLMFGEEINTNISVSFEYEIKLIRIGKYNAVYLNPGSEFLFGNDAMLVTDDTSGNSSDKKTYYMSNTTSGMINFELRLPLSIIFNGSELEIAYVYNKPFVFENNTAYPSVSGFTVSLSYNFFLK